MQQKIFTIRDQKVMLDYQLAELLWVSYEAVEPNGILILASVLKSERAVQVSIALVDVFVKLRAHLSDPLNLRVDRLEKESLLVMKLFDDILKRLHVIEGEGLPKRKGKIGI